MSSSASDPGHFANKSKAYAFVDDGKKRGWMINDGGVMRSMDDEERKEFKIWYKEKYGGGMRNHNKLIKGIMERRNGVVGQVVGQAMQMHQNRRDQEMQRHKKILKKFGFQGLPGMSSVAGSSSSGQSSGASSSSAQKSIGVNEWPGWRGGRQRNVNIFFNGKRVAGNGGDFRHQNQNQGGSGSGSGGHKGTSGSDT